MPKQQQDVSAALSVITPQSVQSLRHCRCKGRCSGSRPGLRTTACTNTVQSTALNTRKDHQFRPPPGLYSTALRRRGKYIKKASIECIPSTDKEFTVGSGKKGHGRHLTFLDLDELLLLPERVRPRSRGRDRGVGEPPAPVPGDHVAVLPG